MDVQAFFDFSFWMSEELLELEAQHAPPTSATNTTKVLH